MGEERFIIKQMKTILLFLSLIPFYLHASDSYNFKEHIWIDVRTATEYDNGHLEGAILIPFDEIAKEISELILPLNTKIYLYCQSGRRAQRALITLRELGYTTVKNVGSLENARKVNLIENKFKNDQ